MRGDAWWTEKLNGTKRQAVAGSLWAAWRDRRERVAIVTGFTGVGKTTLSDALRGRAVEEGKVAVRLSVPSGGTADLDAVLHGLLVQELELNGNAVDAKRAQAASGFAVALREVLLSGALVIIDEFQEVLTAEGTPPEHLIKTITKIAEHVGLPGVLVLVSNREVEGEWIERCHREWLLAPEPAEAERVLRRAVNSAEFQPSAEDAADAVRRLGANPRALTLLGILLHRYTQKELLGDEPDLAPQGPPDLLLVKRLEERLVEKAARGLASAEHRLLDDLAVLRMDADDALAATLAGSSKAWAKLSRPLRDRYLIELRDRRYHVHPVVREVELRRLYQNPEAYRSAHLRAGEWYAGPLRKLSGTGSAVKQTTGLGHRLEEARYHLHAAGAENALQTLLQGLGDYIVRRFNTTTPYPESSAELSARIEFLDIFLKEPGVPGTEQHLAQLLARRQEKGDLERAVVHAKRATSGQMHADPWVLWAKLEAEVNGYEAGAASARLASQAVKPGKNLYAVYQVLGACLTHAGKADDAVEALWKGYQQDTSANRHRLVEQAVWAAAAASDLRLLDGLLQRVEQDIELQPQAALGRALQLQQGGKWRDAAELARREGAKHRNYVHLAMIEALSWLGAGEPTQAEIALKGLPQSLWLNIREGGTWLAALVALQNGSINQARKALSVYLGFPAPTEPEALRAALLREWDERVSVMGEAMPALHFPVLPKVITGYDHDVVRAQHGEPVLPANLKATLPRGGLPGEEPGKTDVAWHAAVTQMVIKSQFKEATLTPIFTWVQLSDIHVGHGDAAHRWDQNLVLEDLVDDLSNLISRGVPKPDVLLVTGDIAFSGGGKPREDGTPNSEYSQAKEWLVSAAAAVNLLARDVYLIPGNHDVDRGVDKDRDVNRLIAALRTNEKLDAALEHAGDRAQLRRRQANYLGLTEHFAESCRNLFWQTELEAHHGKRIVLVGLNTVLLAANDLDRGHLQLGRQQWGQVATARRKDGSIIIALGHHPFQDGWLKDEEDARGWISKYADIHLSGHVHSANSEKLRRGSGGDLIQIVAGAVHAENTPHGPPIAHGYNAASILQDSTGRLCLKVWPRRWSEKNKDFRVDVDNVPSGKDHAEHPLREN
ncbi:metallophosphoesterase [Corallococcus sp. bb12-1]|uniref:metallophosphoesterase n=1 Tax=Corallococcus sp. bb12-1 TaxID=2996784 RepID=UPI002270E41E|nr:metallophosphoesterase [Corallococcus sp. bb12-1]MCY1039753.1 metallophosphoesterase [Corallococcus sp. bb12-1]